MRNDFGFKYSCRVYPVTRIKIHLENSALRNEKCFFRNFLKKLKKVKKKGLTNPKKGSIINELAFKNG